MSARKLAVFVAVALVLASLPEEVFASDSMRCGRHIISAGQRHGPTQYEILKKCGEPSSKTGYTWFYESPRAATRAVVFGFDGTVMRIERLSRSR